MNNFGFRTKVPAVLMVLKFQFKTLQFVLQLQLQNKKLCLLTHFRFIRNWLLFDIMYHWDNTIILFLIMSVKGSQLIL